MDTGRSRYKDLQIIKKVKKLTMNSTYLTKVYLNLGIMGFPTGRSMHCHMWLDGNYEQAEVEENILPNIDFAKYETSDTKIAKAKISYVVHITSKPSTEDFGVVILDNIIDLVNKKETKIYKTKPNLKKIKLHGYTTDELNHLIMDVNVELFKRKYELSDDEYKFYLVNMNDINACDIKEKFKGFNGDAFKIRKNDIRNKLMMN
jgi:hypothetical protein